MHGEGRGPSGCVAHLGVVSKESDRVLLVWLRRSAFCAGSYNNELPTYKRAEPAISLHGTLAQNQPLSCLVRVNESRRMN